ncbi:MAG TPA: HD domain-containing protein [Candidatus Babeliales bacterium]|nr:HD domain-containing protein [Candidatus Babeliales bacterium]
MNRDQKAVISATEQFVREKLDGEGSGHDWWHIYRVWCTAKTIAVQERADLFVVELAAMLHDIADWKFHGGDDSVGPRVAREWLSSLQVEPSVIDHVCQIIKDVSYKGAGVLTAMKTKEGMIVQDADRLDAIGAVGIARCFTYGGHKNRIMYDPAIKPVMHVSFEQYKKEQTTTVNHFYEKLLLLKDRMNTDTAKQIAHDRHHFMEQFLTQFFKEWEINSQS